MRIPLSSRQGFTLMEIMLVLGIMAIIAAIVIVAINPTEQLNDARGANRNITKREIENAISQYIIDGNTMVAPPTQEALAQDICQTAVTGTDCTDAPVSGIDLSVLVSDYLVSIPVDPTETGSTISGYRLWRSGSFYEVCSKHADTGCGV